MISTPPASSGTTSGIDAALANDALRLTQLLQLDDMLRTLAADPGTIRDAIKAVGEDTQVMIERRQP